MKKTDLLWDKFMTSGKVEDYINYCKAHTQMRKEKTDESEHRGSDNQRKEYR